MRIRETTYMVTSATSPRRPVFQVHASAQLLCDVLTHYRDQGNYKLHAFVVMPDHFHAVLTPAPIKTLEQCVQLIKGGSSARLKKGPIWQKGFNEQSLQSEEAYRAALRYVEANPARRGLMEWPFSSDRLEIRLDPMPLRLSGLSRFH
jgi:putative transposase